MPPCPIARASLAAQRRRDRSVNTGTSAACFDRSVPSCTRHGTILTATVQVISISYCLTGPKPTYTVDGKNVVIMQGFKEYFALGFFQGALLKDPKKVLVQLGQVQAGRVMKFTGAKDIRARAATIKAYVREAIAAEKAWLLDEEEEYLRFSGSRGANAAVPKGPAFQARL